TSFRRWRPFRSHDAATRCLPQPRPSEPSGGGPGEVAPIPLSSGTAATARGRRSAGLHLTAAEGELYRGTALSLNQPMDFRGRWVLVTGASSGLGRELTRRLASAYGANLVIVARRRDRLEELRRELETAHRVRVRTLTADLSNLSEVDGLISELKNGEQLYAAILNAGVTHFGRYHELDFADFQKMLHTNVSSVVRLSSELVPYIEHGAPGGGLLFVSSMAGIFPVPYQTAYSGTKAFIVHYACGLWHELRGRNV